MDMETVFYIITFLLLWVFVMALGLSLVAAPEDLFNCAAMAPEFTSSLIVVRGFSCPMATNEIKVPQPGIEPASPELGGGFSTTGSPGKSLYNYYFNTV